MRFLAFLLVTAALPAQVIQVTSLDAATPLNGVWLQQTGDNPRYADPGYDDSQWTSVNMPQPIQPGPYGYTWYRLRIQLPPTDRPLAIAIGPRFPAYEVFANGVKIGSFGGRLDAIAGQHFTRLEGFALPKGEPAIVIAIRSSEWLANFGVQAGPPAAGVSWIGTAEAIDLKLTSARFIRLERSLWMRVLCAGLGFGGLFFVMLALTRTGDREFLWCGLLLLASMLNRLYQIPNALPFASRVTVGILNDISQSAWLVCWVLLLSAIFRNRASKWVWIVAGIYIGIYNIFLFESHVEWVRFHSQHLRSLMIAVSLVAIPLIYYLLGWRGRKPSKSEWFTHFTLLAYLATNSFQNLAGVFNFGPHLRSSLDDSLDLSYVVLRSPILLLFFAMGLILSRRKAETERERARLQQEMSAAAEVQALLLPGAAGDGVEAVYLPASEVGGDFYQVYETSEGARIVLVGDVSGKGLKAAMLVSVAVGIVRNEKSSSPAAILAALNAGLIGRSGGGFVTCCCARFDADGSATIANAGHPSPYCDGREVEVEAGLPLGIAPGVQYAESIMRGERFTLVSDGVVEAENGQRELFGFDRTREISGRSAQEIAQAAQAWGQNDDITVVTVRRLA